MKKNKAFSLVELSVVILIIGILVAGISQSGRLIRQIKISTARSVTSSSDVGSIRDVTAWFETSTDGVFTNINDVTDVEDDNEIKTWRDINPQKSIGDKSILTQATSTQHPKFKSNGINGIPTLVFDGNDFMKANDPSTMPIIPADKSFSMFAVFRTKLTFNQQKSLLAFVGGNTIANDTYASIGFLGSSGNNAKPGFIVNTGTNNANWVRDVGIIDETDYALGAVVDFNPAASADSVKIFLNSIDPIASASLISGGTYVAPVLNSQQFVVGGLTDLFFNGWISEIIIFDRTLKKEEYQNTMKYLKKKYNILG
ncbi:MAG: type II secretion system protein [Rickettsiales bacterium]